MENYVNCKEEFYSSLQNLNSFWESGKAKLQNLNEQLESGIF